MKNKFKDLAYCELNLLQEGLSKIQRNEINIKIIEELKIDIQDQMKEIEEIWKEKL